MKRMLLLSIVFLLVFSTTAMADDKVIGKEGYDSLETMEAAEPRFTHLGYYTVGLEIEEDGHVIFGGSANALGYDIRLTLYLQQSDNGVIWDNISGSIKTDSDHVQIESTRILSEGDKFYRTKLIAEVLDANDNVLETVTGYSSEERY